MSGRAASAAPAGLVFPRDRLSGVAGAEDFGIDQTTGLDRHVLTALANELASSTDPGFHWPALQRPETAGRDSPLHTPNARQIKAEGPRPPLDTWWPQLLTTSQPLSSSHTGQLQASPLVSSRPVRYDASAARWDAQIRPAQTLIGGFDRFDSPAFPDSEPNHDPVASCQPVSPNSREEYEGCLYPSRSLPSLRPRAIRVPATDLPHYSDSGEEDPTPAAAGRDKQLSPRPSVDQYKASVTARNRERQQRFRRRQKARIADLEAQVALLSVQSQAMDQERGTFNKTITALNGTIAARDQQLMDTNARLAEAQQQLLTKGPLAAPSPSDSGDGNGNSADGVGSLVLTLHDEPITLSSVELKNIRPADVAQWWKEYVRQLAVLLLSEKGEQELPEGALERIAKLVSEQLALMRHVWVSSHDAYELFQAKGKMEDLHMPWEENGPQRWRKLVRSLYLSEEQRNHILQLRRHLRTRLHTIREQRRTLHKGLLACLDDTASTGRDVAIQRFKANKSVDVLKQSLRQENLLVREFVSCMYQQVLTPVQVAKCLVQSYPWYPDCQGIANWVAAEAGLPAEAAEAAELLRRSPNDSIFDEHQA